MTNSYDIPGVTPEDQTSVIQNLINEAYAESREVVGNPVYADLSEEQIEFLKQNHPDLYRASFPLITNKDGDLVARHLPLVSFLEVTTSEPKRLGNTNHFRDIEEQQHELDVAIATRRNEISIGDKRISKPKTAMIIAGAALGGVLAFLLDFSHVTGLIGSFTLAAGMGFPRVIESKVKRLTVEPIQAEPTDGNICVAAGDYVRERELYLQRGVLLSSEIENKAEFDSKIRALSNQAKRALKDNSPFIEFGESIGAFQERGMLLSPDKGAKVGTTLLGGNDPLDPSGLVGIHMFVAGSTGTGKTEYLKCVLAQALYAAQATGTKIGTLNADEKAEFAFAIMHVYLENGEDYTIISDVVREYVIARHKTLNLIRTFENLDQNYDKFAKEVAEVIRFKTEDPAYQYSDDDFDFEVKKTFDVTQLSLTHGLNALEVVTVFSSTLISREGEKIWSDSADTLFRYAEFVNEFVCKYGPQIHERGRVARWTIPSAMEMLTDKHYFMRAVASVNAKIRYEVQKTHPHYADAIKNIIDHHLEADKDNKTTQGVFFTIKNAYDKLCADPLVRKVLDNEDGVNAVAVCKGAHVGIAIPPAYGKAGEALAAFTRKQVQFYRDRIANRWKDIPGEVPVIVLHDEFQNASDVDQVNTLVDQNRSKGLTNIFATQSIDAMQDKLSREKAVKEPKTFTKTMMNNIGNLITFASSEETFQNFNEIAGVQRQIVSCKANSNGVPVGMYYHMLVRNALMQKETYINQYETAIGHLQRQVDTEYNEAEQENRKDHNDKKFQVQSANRRNVSTTTTFGIQGGGSTTVSEGETKLSYELIDSPRLLAAREMKERLAEFRSHEVDPYVAFHRGFCLDYPISMEELKDLNKFEDRVKNQIKDRFFFTTKTDMIINDSDKSATSIVKDRGLALVSLNRYGTKVNDVIDVVQYWRDGPRLKEEIFAKYGVKKP